MKETTYYMLNKIAVSKIEPEKKPIYPNQLQKATQETSNKRNGLQLDYDVELMDACSGDDEIFENCPDHSSTDTLQFLDLDVPTSELQLEDEQIDVIHSTDKINSEENSSDAESDDDDFNNTDLKSSLAIWSLQHNVSHQGLSDLLKILQPILPEHNLPGDACSLLKTKRSFNFKSVSSDRSNPYYCPKYHSVNRFINNMFTIVLFTQKNKVEGVPSSWVFNKNLENWCFWPSCKNDVEKLILNCETPKDDWKTYPVKIVCNSRSYEKMIKKRSHARSKSGISDSEFEPSHKKQRMRRLSYELDESELYTNENLSPVPSPPSKYNRYFNNCIIDFYDCMYDECILIRDSLFVVYLIYCLKS